MAVYDVGKYRNIALIGHGHSGKTTLAEALLFKTGVTTRLGSVQDKTSILDYSEESREKLSSLSSALCYLNYKGHHVNIIDTPGTTAFCGEAIAALAAVELGVLAISASSGIQVNSRKMFERARDYGLGLWIVVTHIDAPNVDLPGLVVQIQESFGTNCVPLNLPKKGKKGVIDCFTNPSGEADFDRPRDVNTALTEAIVGVDDALMEQYLAGDLGPDKVAATAPRAVASGALIPILFVDSRGDVGVVEFLDSLITFCPSPLTGLQRELVDGEHKTPVKPDPAGPFVGQVFKIGADAKTHIKHLLIRIHSGKLTSDMTIKAGKESKGVRPGQLMRTLGAEHSELEAGVPGDIVTLSKLDFKIGDVAYTNKGGTIAMPIFPNPMFALAITSKARGDEDKITAALKHFTEEDHCLIFERGAGGEMVVRGMGETQLRTYFDRMAKLYKVHVDTHPPRIPYRETINGEARDIEYTHKKQSGGAGQYAKVVINVLPAARGEGYEFVDKIFGGAIDQQFRPSVDKGVRAQLVEGVLAGYPVVDVKVELTDGKTHPVDSKDIAFQIAGRSAFKEGFLKAKPVLLEPVVHLEVTVPSENVGDIQGDLATRRGRPQGQDVIPGNMVIIRALVPLAELADYNSRLSSISAGQGSYSIELSHYDVVPSNIQQQVVEAHKKLHQHAAG